MQPGQKIHASVLEFMKSDTGYAPAAKLNNGLEWADIKTWDKATIEASSIIVKDLYSSATDIMDGLMGILSAQEKLQIMRRHTDRLGELAASCQ